MAPTLQSAGSAVQMQPRRLRECFARQTHSSAHVTIDIQYTQVFLKFDLLFGVVLFA